MDVSNAKQHSHLANNSCYVIDAWMVYICQKMKLQSMKCFLNISHFAYQIANQVITNLLMIRSNRNVQSELVPISRALDKTATFNSTFRKCQKCTNDKICKTCNDNDVDSCLTCYDDFSSDLNGTCDTCIANPKFCEYGDCSDSCSACMDGFGMHYSECIRCFDQNCLECENSKDCLLCPIKYQAVNLSLPNQPSIYGRQCKECNNKLNYLDKYYPDCASCEIDPSNLTNITCKACVNGYIFNETGDCLSKCPTGYYGVSVYSRRAMLEQSYCERCNSSCEECFDSQYCKSCPIGQYLDRLSFDQSYGNCKVKLQSNYTGILYITNNNISVDVQTLNGSQSKPFGDLEDGIIRANELASKYLFADITIYLQNTSDYGLNHYLLRTGRDFYQPLFYERDSQNLKLIIKPDPSTVDEGEKITILNKRRDKFQLRVGRGLTLENIIIDSLDSILPIDKDGSGCLQRKEKCCEMGSDGVISSKFNNSQCLDLTGNLHLQILAQCWIADGPSFINFDINDKTLLHEPQQLIIDLQRF
eukprot:403376225